MLVTVTLLREAVTPDPGSTTSAGMKNVMVSSYHVPVTPFGNVSGQMVGKPLDEVHAGSASQAVHCAVAE